MEESAINSNQTSSWLPAAILADDTSLGFISKRWQAHTNPKREQGWSDESSRSVPRWRVGLVFSTSDH